MNATIRGYRESVRVWLDRDLVLLMDADSPTLDSDLPAILETLGTPEAQLDAYFGTLFLPKCEWVFPARGLTLYVNLEDRSLLRLVVYAATTLSTYRARLQLNLRTHRLPPDRDSE